MTPEQMQMVRLSLAQATTDPHALGREFYPRLFVLAPDLRTRFNGNIDDESVKLKEALTLAFASLTDMPFLVATLEALASRGIARDMTEMHCRAVAQALLWAVERRMGAAFTHQVCNAWIAFLAVTVSLLRGPAIEPMPARRRLRVA